MDISLLIIILSIIFISTLTRSTFGFGDALIAMPLLALFIDIKIATPLIALIAFFIAISILIRNWRNVEFKSAWRLIVSSLIGIPIGIWYLKDINENFIKLILGIIVLLFALYSAIKPKLIHLKNEKYSWLFGFIAGLLGGAYNTNGPPIVVYSSLKKWNPKNFRATLQGYFFTTGIMVIVGHGAAGNFTSEVLTYFAYCLPIVLVAVIIGASINKRIPTQNFHKYIYMILAMLGFALMVNSILNMI
ncbi:MAG: sulfite exporter TauE/SafE family protein [Marinilabiliales bacterium]|nr:MAG: sulfite exporter TauE/SafE family protein [Marinilabiliales bacterium]